MQLNVKDVAQILNVSEKTIYRWISQGDIPAYRFQDQYRFNHSEIIEWAMARKINVSSTVFEEPPVPETGLPSLREAVEMGGIVYRLEGQDRESVLRHIVKAMPLPEEMDREFLYQSFMAREKACTTALGNGIAIPHARIRVVPQITRPMVTLAFLEYPVDFNALDGKPVQVLFAVVSPTIQGHLHIVSRLAFVLRDPEFLSVLQRQGLREEILNQAARTEGRLAFTQQCFIGQTGRTE